ncbi:MAG: hypothetical protein RL721_2314 [Candidatus Eisenbacteria bacterium]
MALLVLEVHEAPVALVGLIVLDGLRGQLVHLGDGRGHVLVQSRMALDRMDRSDNRSIEADRLLAHLRLATCECGPVGPRREPSLGQLVEEHASRVHDLPRLLGGVELRVLDERLQRITHGLLERCTVGVGSGQMRHQARETAPGGGAQFIGTHAIAASVSGDRTHALEPLQAGHAVLEVYQRLHGIAAGVHLARLVARAPDLRGEGLLERLLGGLLVEDAEFGRQAEFEGVIGHQTAADGVHRADASQRHALCLGHETALEQSAPHALSQFRGRLHGEGGGDHRLRSHRTLGMRERLHEHLDETVGLARTRAGGDDMDVLHASPFANARPQSVA